MNEIDSDRLKNLKLSLSAHISELNDAYEKKNYNFMSDVASTIEKIAYTITYLEADCRIRNGSNDSGCTTQGVSPLTDTEEDEV